LFLVRQKIFQPGFHLEFADVWYKKNSVFARFQTTKDSSTDEDPASLNPLLCAHISGRINFESLRFKPFN
jgi:hypothetical protein